ncbi:MAG: serine/threonine-protein kinase [Ornithinimicrobium sp.]|uniref:serine/threonine-protein kinase n=1 Tax=Ornithinimicrobium sp. TaxID=1977084 RepID=UPI0026E09E93|nr:serine/threonine-protein kinase [Ornithinimicrobium sp.]MDO5739581.1 serine/threonine-protein kinase [Ornithinimicrobium sp.]
MPQTTTPSPVGDDPGVIAGRYQIQHVLGRGGGGIVWLALDQHLGRKVALKKVAGEADAEILVTRGLREARTSAALAHDHVVRVYDAFEFEGAPWIVMEYVPGPSLAALLEDGRSLPPSQVALIGAQVARALAAAHRAGILHRDVKPANVLLTDPSGRTAKLTDFGIARAEDDHQLTRTGMVSGTAAYFSPELAQGEGPSPATDVWALGATLYAAVEGRRPFPDAANAVAQLHTIVREEPREPQQAGPLTPVLAGMLDGDPARRWTAEQAAHALDRINGTASSTGDTAAPGLPAAAQVWRGAATQAQSPVGRTREQQVAAPAPSPASSTPAPPTRSPSPIRRPPGPRPPARRRQSTSRVMAWVLGILLTILLGWLVYTIATGATGLGGPTTSREHSDSSAPEGTPVTAKQAEQLVRDWYSTLQADGLPAAQKLMLPSASVDPAIAEGLDDITLSDVTTTVLPNGSATVSLTASYDYGSSLIVQREDLIVTRSDGHPRIASRGTTMLDG